jgi:hypothetical protein
LKISAFLSDLQKRRRTLADDFLERVRGIEPPSSAWEAAALPLSYTREVLGDCHSGGARVKRISGYRAFAPIASERQISLKVN